jgi:DNA-3-methyladenine glycosylase II
MPMYGDGTPLDAPDTHLAAADPVLAALIRRYGPLDQGLHLASDDLYGALILATTSRQLSTHSARAGYARLTARYGGRTPTPGQLLADDPEAVRVAAGLSHAKTASLLSLAAFLTDGRLDLCKLPELGDEDVTRNLTQVKGIGERTAAVFLIFALHRPDILASGDPGIRQAARTAYHLDALPTPQALTRIAEQWRPYRTRASFYLWQSL